MPLQTSPNSNTARHCIGSFDTPVNENTVCDICGLKLKEHPWFDDVTISPVSVDLKEKK